ncbi:hypothetical protein L3V32_04125 [Vibrio sp. J2-4]|uniref:hypothetical protein n=1 Tax=Vibrio sp. J2-4 TaxID=1507977 RepID=UPI001F3EA15F|nr:hypothetical protein [Vibrio sp. J2-4]MCF7475890.1 hypothetical protein [Vibrio sp. J2-4]
MGYSELSQADIDKKVEAGEFKRDEVVVRDNRTKQVVRFEKKSRHESEIFPNTFIQVNNNYIYQFDIKEVLCKIKEQNLKQEYSELEVKYNILLDFIEMHDEEDDFTSDIYSNAVSLSREFESKVAQLIKELDLQSDDNVDRLVNVLKAYVNVIFSYAIFMFIKDRSKRKVKSVIDKKILALRNLILPLYKDLLMPFTSVRKDYSNEIIEVPDLDNSFYIKHFESRDLNIKVLDLLVDFDDRYQSSVEIFELCKDHNYALQRVSDSRHHHYGKPPRDNLKEIAYRLYYILVDLSKIEELINEVDQLELKNEDLKKKIFTRLEVN